MRMRRAGGAKSFSSEATKGLCSHPPRPKPGSSNVLHVFASRAEAERHMKTIGAKRVIADPIADFIATTLPWAGACTRSAMIEPITGAGFIEVKIADLNQRLTSPPPAP